MLSSLGANMEQSLKLLSPIVVAFSVLWLVTVIQKRVTSTKEPRTPSSGKSKIRNEFQTRPGVVRSLFVNWKTAHDYRGWFVLTMILSSAFLIRNFSRNFKKNGSIFSVSGGNFLKQIFIVEMTEFVTVILFIYFFSFFAFAIQKIMIQLKLKYRARMVLHVVQHITQLAFALLVSIYLLHRKYEVSISYRFAVIAETFVMYMKMVSYLGTNHYLYLETAETGEKVPGPYHTAVELDEVDKLDIASINAILISRGIDTASLQIEEAKNLLIEIIKLDEYRKSIYPRNVTLANFIEFSCLPVLVYEPKYPRTKAVNWLNLAEKLITIAGIIVFNWFLWEEFILPAIHLAVVSPDGTTVPVEHLIEGVLDMIIPLKVFVILIFYLVFECVLGAAAELLKLADCDFYADWWNSTTFEEFSRKWNKPVHEFLLRHIHFEAQHVLGVSRMMATIITFLYSIVLHEVVLLSMFGIFRPYLAFFSLFQIPLWKIMRSPIFHNHIVGNFVFWGSLTVAWPLMVILYCRDYCMQDPRNCRI